MYEKDYLAKKQSRFQGPPVGTLLKIQNTNHATLARGPHVRKRPGNENYFSKNQKTGFDFLSVHACYTPEKIIHRVIVGDYKLQGDKDYWHGAVTLPGNRHLPLVTRNPEMVLLPTLLPMKTDTCEAWLSACTRHARLPPKSSVSYKKTDGNLADLDTLSPKTVQTATLYETGYHEPFRM